MNRATTHSKQRACCGSSASGLLALIAALAVAIPSVVPVKVLACGGTPVLVCGRTTVLVKAMPFIVIIGPAGGVVPVPVMVIISAAPPPPAPPCPFPVSTTITLNMICFPAPPPPGGVGSIGIATPTPGVYFTAVPIFIPPGPIIRFCPIGGTAATTWADGVVTVGVGDTAICVVEPSPGDPTVPRLNLELLTPEIQAAHPGDQRVHVMRLTNNDPTNAVMVSVSGTSTQVSRLPTFSPPPAPGSGDGAYSISDPGLGDNFPIAFAEDLLPNPPAGNNYLFDDGGGEQNLGLNPLGALIWLNQFSVLPGREVIDKISVAYGPGVNGKPVNVLLYDDPNNDGDPADAVLLARTDAVAANAGTNVYNDVTIQPTDVGAPGESYFVGVVMQRTSDPPERPARLDNSSNLNRSWIAASDPCGGNVVTLSANALPPTRTGDLGFPGNLMIRTNGGPGFPKVPCIPLPPDPTMFPPPTIMKTLTLCPGEVRVIQVATRSWPMCSSGSCSEQIIRVDGTFANGDPALACLGVAMHADTSVAPEYACADSGMISRSVLQPPAAIQFLGNMPTHPINTHAQIVNTQLVPGGGPPFQPTPPQISLLGAEHGRISIEHANLGPPFQVNVLLNVSCIVEISPKIPVIDLELLELHLHTAPPAQNDSFFFILGRSSVTGPGIPPTLDSFFDVFSTVSLDGISGGLHRSGRILPLTIAPTILDPHHYRLDFRAVFDPQPGLPPVIDRVRLLLDSQGNSHGVPNGPDLIFTGGCCLPGGGCMITDAVQCNGLGGTYLGDGATCAGCPTPCPGAIGDVNCDNSIDFFDIDPFLLALFDLPTYLATYCGGSICAADIDCSGQVDFFDIDPLLLCLFSACPPCP